MTQKNTAFRTTGLQTPLCIHILQTLFYGDQNLMHSDLQTGRVREGNVYEFMHIVIETLVEISESSLRLNSFSN
jgi:hypothetical protein